MHKVRGQKFPYSNAFFKKNRDQVKLLYGEKGVFLLFKSDVMRKSRRKSVI